MCLESETKSTKIFECLHQFIQINIFTSIDRRGEGNEADNTIDKHQCTRQTLGRALSAQVTSRWNGTIKHRLLSKSESLFHGFLIENAQPMDIRRRRDEEENEWNGRSECLLFQLGRLHVLALATTQRSEHWALSAQLRQQFVNIYFIGAFFRVNIDHSNYYWPFSVPLRLFHNLLRLSFLFFVWLPVWLQSLSTAEQTNVYTKFILFWGGRSAIRYLAATHFASHNFII